MREKLKFVPPLFLGLITIWFRLLYLGYSDYEPDERKALFLAPAGQNLVEFLLKQRKGPTQFIVTYLVRFFTPNYDNSFITRLPFALAGILAVFVFYRLVNLHYGRKIAFYATLLLTTNGLIIGLTRVVQYQPFLMLFSLCALYAFSLAIMDPRRRISGIYAGMFFWTAALLTHYDGIFISPFALYLLYRWYRQQCGLPVSAWLKHLVLPVLLSALLLSCFYIPLFFSLSNDTLEYWSYRFSGVSTTLPPSSSIFTFKLYNPLLVLEVYFSLGLLAAWKIKHNWPVLAWFLFPWGVLELLIQEPGTHIYAYIIPATILVAFGLLVIEELYAARLSRFIPIQSLRGAPPVIFMAVLFGGLICLSNLIFIDHPPEYPWETKVFLIAKIGGLRQPPYKVWAYGFPHNRHWLEIRDYVLSNDPNGYYCTNEDKAVSYFYMPLVNDIEKSGYYIHIHNPIDLKEDIAKFKINYWMSRYPPVKVFMNDGVIVSEIYKMPPGDPEWIIRRGY